MRERIRARDVHEHECAGEDDGVMRGSDEGKTKLLLKGMKSEASKCGGSLRNT
jgi:hypothetical protein